MRGRGHASRITHDASRIISGPMRCPECNTRVITGLTTCPECGASLAGERTEGSAARVLGTMAREDQGDLNLPRKPSFRADATSGRQDAPPERVTPSGRSRRPHDRAVAVNVSRSADPSLPARCYPHKRVRDKVT